MTDQELIQWGREMRPNDDNLIEAGTPAETEASLVYLWDVVLAEGERG